MVDLRQPQVNGHMYSIVISDPTYVESKVSMRYVQSLPVDSASSTSPVQSSPSVGEGFGSSIQSQKT